jgi:hypothetical protein
MKHSSAILPGEICLSHDAGYCNCLPTRVSTKIEKLVLWQAAKRILQWTGVIAFAGCLSTVARAQTTLSAGDVYHVIGEYDQSYFRSNIDLSVFIGNPGSNYWDFSQPQAANEVVARMDVVPVSDGGIGGAFTGATFALRYEGGANSETSWEYYSLDSTNGLVLYGTYEAVGYGSNPSIPIDPPTSVLPWLVQYGDSWTIAYGFDVTDPLFGVIPVSYTSTSTVDAYGTMVLPGIGAVSALRITEVEDYEEDIFGYEFPQLDTNWTWLAPGIGFAAQAINLGPDSYSSSAETYTNSFSRVFLSPPLAASPAAQLVLQSNVAELTWSSIPKASGYAVQTSTNLSVAQWSMMAQLTNQFLAVPIASGVSLQFFRVQAQP